MVMSGNAAHPIDILTTANTMWTGLGSNWGFFGDRLVTALAMFQPKMYSLCGKVVKRNPNVFFKSAQNLSM